MERAVADELRIFPSLAALTSAAAEHITERAQESVRSRGRFRWVLSGGHTPEGLYRTLAERYRRTFPWGATEVYFGDERCVSPRSALSNYAMARSALLAHVPIPSVHVHRMHGEERPPSAAAATYASTIRNPHPGKRSSVDPFDLVLLGVGPDGHTASLFPGAPALREKHRTVVSVRHAGQPPRVPRITLTLPALAHSDEIVFLVSGADKAAAMAAIWSARPRGNDRYPASRVRSSGVIRWFIDEAAAAERSL